MDPIFWTVAGAFGTAALGLGVWSVQQAVVGRREARKAKLAEGEKAIEEQRAARILQQSEAAAAKGDSALRDMLVIRVDGLLAQQRTLADAIRDHAAADQQAIGALHVAVARSDERIALIGKQLEQEQRRRHDFGDALQKSLNAIYEKLGMMGG